MAHDMLFDFMAKLLRNLCHISLVLKIIKAYGLLFNSLYVQIISHIKVGTLYLTHSGQAKKRRGNILSVEQYWIICSCAVLIAKVKFAENSISY